MSKTMTRKYGGKSKWDLRALGVNTKPLKKSKAGGTKPVYAKPSATKVSNSTNANDETMNMNMNEEPVNMNMSNEGGKVQDKEVMEMFRRFQEAQAAEAQAAGGVDGCSEASKACIASEPSTASNDKPSFDFGTSEPSNIFGTPDSSNIFGAPSTFNTLATSETSNIFGLRESPTLFDDKPSFNFATTSSGDLVLLDSQGSKVSVLGTYSIPAKDRLPTFEGEVVRFQFHAQKRVTHDYVARVSHDYVARVSHDCGARVSHDYIARVSHDCVARVSHDCGADDVSEQDFFRDWTEEQLDEEQHAPINDRKSARLRLRRKRFDFVGEPGYRVYLARRERRLSEDEEDFLPRKRMHTTQDLANMRAKWKVRRERPLRERAMRRCLRERVVRRGVVGREVGKDADKARKGEREVNKVEEEAGDKGWKVLARQEADGSMGDDGCRVDEVYAVGGDEQAMGDGDHPMGDEDHPMNIDQAEDGEDDDDDDGADAPRAPFRRESTPEPEGEEDWIM